MMLHRLWHGDREESESARDELRALGPKAAIAVADLGDALVQGGPQVQRHALFVLEGLGESARPALPAIVGAMKGDDPELAFDAADALGTIGLAAVSDLVLCLGDDRARVRLLACRGLGAIGPAAAVAAGPLLEVADRDEPDVRRRAIWALGRMQAADALEPMAAMLTDEGGEIGCAVAEALSMYGRDARPVAPALRDELHRDDRILALACADALRVIGSFRDAAVWSLISCLQESSDEDERIEATMLLGDFGPAATAALPALHGAQTDENDELRAQAAMATAKIRPAYRAVRREAHVNTQ